DSFPPSTPRQRSGRPSSSRAAPPQIVRPILGALGVFVVLAGIGLGIALVTGATQAFNILVWAAFTVLWIAFAVALAFSPCRYPDLGSMREVKAPHAVLQAVPAGPEGLPARVAIADAPDEPAQPRHPAPELAHGQRLGWQVQTARQHRHHLQGHRRAGRGGGRLPAEHAQLEQPHSHD